MEQVVSLLAVLGLSESFDLAPEQLQRAGLQVNQVLNKARDDAGRYAQASLRDTNNVVRMVTAGSKVLTTMQTTACNTHNEQ
jgi:RNA polymerase Rpb1, domain 4